MPLLLKPLFEDDGMPSLREFQEEFHNNII
jgi:hypothetical protein